MKRVFFLLFAFCLLVLLPQQLSGQSSHARVKATIPCGFQVGNTVLPAGTYLFSFDTVEQVAWIQGLDQQRKIAVLTTDVSGKSEPHLIFKRSGNTMVLHQVIGGDAVNGSNSHDLNHSTLLAEL